MGLIRAIVVMLLSIGLLVGMVTIGAFVLLAGLAIGLAALGWHRLRGRDFVNPADQFGQAPRPPEPPTIEAEYEVVEESIRFEEKDKV